MASLRPLLFALLLQPYLLSLAVPTGGIETETSSIASNPCTEKLAAEMSSTPYSATTLAVSTPTACASNQNAATPKYPCISALSRNSTVSSPPLSRSAVATTVWNATTSSTSTRTSASCRYSPLAKSGEIVKNAGFESNCLDPWKITADKSAVNISITRLRYNNSDAVFLASFHSTEPASMHITQVASCTKGVEYSFTAEFKYGVLGRDCELCMYADHQVQLYLGANYAQTDDWQIATGDWFTPMNNTAQLEIAVSCTGGLQDFYLDNIMVKQSPTIH